MYMDNLLWTDLDAGTTADTLVLFHLCNTIGINMDSIELARFHTGTAANAAIAAFWLILIGFAAAIAGNQCRLIWEFLFDCHAQLFLSYGVLLMGRL